MKYYINRGRKKEFKIFSSRNEYKSDKASKMMLAVRMATLLVKI